MQKIFVVLWTILLCSTGVFSDTYQCNILSTCGCSNVSSVSVNQRIVGGEVAPQGAWQWMVSLRYYGSHTCGASLISSQFAVTAAHCVYGRSSSAFSIVVGSNYLSVTSGTGIQGRSVTNIYIHPSYNANSLNNDIALLKFSALRTDGVWKLARICLPSQGVDPFTTGTKLVATGWGYTQEGGSVSNQLRQVTVLAIASNASSCIQAPIVNPTIRFCAGLEQGGKDTCQGDSGGPLMSFSNSRWVLAGITSSGYGCARPGYPGLYTRVSNYRRYIKSITGF